MLDPLSSYCAVDIHLIPLFAVSVAVQFCQSPLMYVSGIGRWEIYTVTVCTMNGGTKRATGVASPQLSEKPDRPRPGKPPDPGKLIHQ